MDPLCTGSVDNYPCPLLCGKHAQMVPTSGRWSKLLVVGTTGALESAGGDSGLEYSQYFEVLYCGYCLISKVFGGSILRVLPVLGVMYSPYSQYSRYLALSALLILILPVLAVFGLPVPQYSQYSEYEVHSILPSILGV